jgi:hypothetical protein
VGSIPTLDTGAAFAAHPRCLGVAALHTALSKQKYGIDTRRHRFVGPVVQRPRRLRHVQETMVRVHAGSLTIGLLVQQEDVGIANRKSECKSPAVH